MTKKQNMEQLIEGTKLQWRIRMEVSLKQLDQLRMPKRKKSINMWQLLRENLQLSIRPFREMLLSRSMMPSCAISLRNGQMTCFWSLYLRHTTKVDQIREAITNHIINNHTIIIRIIKIKMPTRCSSTIIPHSSNSQCRSIRRLSTLSNKLCQLNRWCTTQSVHRLRERRWCQEVLYRAMSLTQTLLWHLSRIHSKFSKPLLGVPVCLNLSKPWQNPPLLLWCPCLNRLRLPTQLCRYKILQHRLLQQLLVPHRAQIPSLPPQATHLPRLRPWQSSSRVLPLSHPQPRSPPPQKLFNHKLRWLLHSSSKLWLRWWHHLLSRRASTQACQPTPQCSIQGNLSNSLPNSNSLSQTQPNNSWVVMVETLVLITLSQPISHKEDINLKFSRSNSMFKRHINIASPNISNIIRQQTWECHSNHSNRQCLPTTICLLLHNSINSLSLNISRSKISSNSRLSICPCLQISRQIHPQLRTPPQHHRANSQPSKHQHQRHRRHLQQLLSNSLPGRTHLLN